MTQKTSDLEQEIKRLRESVPENDVASLQEELAAAKLREAEANLALKELRSKVAELSAMWQKHLKRNNLDVSDDGTGNGGGSGPSSTTQGIVAAPSTPKKLLGSLLDGGRSSEVARLEEDVLTARMKEVESQAELKDQRLKVMELETNVRY